MSEIPADKPEAIVIDMDHAARLIREAREARAKRKAERENTIHEGDTLIFTPSVTGTTDISIPFPGGIDDMGLG